MERSYIAFISYKHTEHDAAIAKQVHTLIENYIIPRSLRKDTKKLGIVFRDEEELPISSDLTESICEALDASRYLIVVCSPEAKQSPWVAREINYFLAHHRPEDAFVVLVGGEPGDVFPPQLTHILDPETGAYQDVEPLALDVRADTLSSSLKKTRAQIKKLLAGMLGCSYDSLVQREKARRMKRISAMIAMCLLLAASFIGMLFAKNQELTRKNQQLTEAIELSLRREADLLVKKAEDALQSGDIAAAMQFAGDALYSADIQRPYSPQAERLLFSTLDVLGEEADLPLLSRVALTHRAPVEMMACTTDGSIVYTIDAYGTVSSFDSADGKLHWSCKLKEKESGSSSPLAPQLWYDEENQRIGCYYADSLWGLNAATGQILWQTRLENTADAGFFFEAESRQLACIEREFILSSSSFEYCFCIFSLLDGSLLGKIPLITMPMGESAAFYRTKDSCSGGMFSGADCFVGTAFKTENLAYKGHLYLINLSENKVTWIENPALDQGQNYLKTHVIGDERALVFSCTGNRLYAQCFDTKTGGLLWESEAELGKYTSSYANFLVLAGKKEIIIGWGENMAALSVDTGNVLATVTLQAEIADLYELSSGLFGFTLKNGYCAVGWRNAAGLMDSAAFDTTIDLPDTEKVLTPQYGLIQVYFTGSTIDGFSTLPLKEGGGMIICLSADERTAYVTSILPSPVLPEAVFLQAADAASVYGGSLLDITPQGTALTGWVKQSDGQGLNLVDTVNHTFSTLVIPDAETLKYCDQFSLTKDNRYIIAWNEGGRIYRIGADGQTETLALGEHVVLDKINDLEMVDAKYWADAARQTADGSIIAATCDGKQITFWRDGGQMENIPVPQDTRWTVVSGWSMPRLFRIGPNGLMVLSDFASEASTELEHFSVYHFAEKKWKQMDDAAHGSPDRLMAFGRQSPVFAVYDEDMRLRIYDYHAAAPVHCMPIDLPAISIAKIEMLLDDQYICLLTKDGQAMIYCIQTNELVFCTAVDTDYATVDADQFFLWPDPANQRLYLSSGQHVQCIDLRTWEPLFTGKNFAFYHAGQNEIYVKVYDWADSTISLKAVPIPSTDQMIEITRNALY